MGLREWFGATPQISEAAKPVERLPNVVRRGFEQGIPVQGINEINQGIGEATGSDRRTILSQLHDAYLTCPWSWAAVNAIARSVTGGGLVFDWDGDDGEGDQGQPDKPADVLACERLLRFVNPREDIRQLLRGVIADLLVFGDAYLEVVWLGPVPVALFSLDAPSMFPVADQHGSVTGYVQLTELGQRAEFDEREIIHISLDSPRSGIYGISPTQAALMPITTWLFTSATLKGIFRKGMPPSLHVDLPASYSPNEVTRWQQQYATRNLGPSNIGIPVTTKGGGQVKELAQGKVDALLHTLDQKRDEILACVIPGTKIVARTGLVAIENVTPGMQVLTHRGNWKRVTEVMVNSAYKPVVEVKANGFDSLFATTNHPVWTARYRQDRNHHHHFDGHQWVSAGYLKPRVRNRRGASDGLTLTAPDITNNSGVLHCADYLILGARNTSCGWVAQKSWDDGEFIRHSSAKVRPIPSEIKMTRGLGRLLGLYLAEGHAVNGVSLVWSFHEDETHLIDEVRAELEANFGLTNVTVASGTGKGKNVRVGSQFLTELFDCGKALTKRLPDWAWNGTAEFFEGVLTGWNDGDGITDTRNGRHDGDGGARARACTKSETLAWQMRLIAAALGIPASLAVNDRKVEDDRKIGGYQLRSNGPTYVLGWPLDPRREGIYRIEDGALVSPIRAVDPTDYTGVVYNLEVEDDHSYVTTSGTVHNCYGVPPAEAGVIESGNLGGGTGEAQHRMFMVNTCAPIGNLILEKLNYALVRNGFGIDGWHLKFHEIDLRDSQIIEQIRDMRLRNGSWTLNKLRTEIGEPPVDGGDDAVLVDRQNLVLWRDMETFSTANIAAKAKGSALEPEAPTPGSAVTLDKPAPAPASAALQPSAGQDNEPGVDGQQDDSATGQSGDGSGQQESAPRHRGRPLRESWAVYSARIRQAMAELPQPPDEQ